MCICVLCMDGWNRVECDPCHVHVGTPPTPKTLLNAHLYIPLSHTDKTSKPNAAGWPRPARPSRCRKKRSRCGSTIWGARRRGGTHGPCFLMCVYVFIVGGWHHTCVICACACVYKVRRNATNLNTDKITQQDAGRRLDRCHGIQIPHPPAGGGGGGAAAVAGGD